MYRVQRARIARGETKGLCNSGSGLQWWLSVNACEGIEAAGSGTAILLSVCSRSHSCGSGSQGMSLFNEKLFLSTFVGFVFVFPLLASPVLCNSEFHS